MKAIFKFFLVILLLVSSLTSLWAQSLPVGSLLLEDAYRRAQLLGKLDSTVSFTSRPFYPSLNANNISLTENFNSTISNQTTNKPEIKILPLSIIQQYNSHHPEGLNNGAIIPAKGYQTYITGGFFAKFGIVSFQFMPEFVWAQNPDYPGFPDEHPDEVWKKYNIILQRIDLPERFGDKAYSKAFWGQSSLRLTYKALSIGISNENLWWGPGIHNSLLMTNNAPGFKHLTFNTVKPVKSPIGSFEWQLITGRLEASGYPNIDPARLLAHKITYIAKPDDWRYFNGIVLSYQPKWLPGLFLGATRSFTTYSKDVEKSLNGYLPVITPITKKAVGGVDDDARKSNQLASVFMRWVSPEAHQEVYLEYGREDHNYHLNDFMLETSHASAYILGLRKLVPIKARTNEFIDFHLELTQLESNVSTTQRAGGNWYTHYQVLHGYTNNGQYIGAGIGSGSNMQTLDIKWTKNLKTIGFQLKRLVHNNDFWYAAFKDYRIHWVDFGGSIFGTWNYKNLLLNARIEALSSINYQFLYNPIPSDPPFWWDYGNNTLNIHATLGITYIFGSKLPFQSIR